MKRLAKPPESTIVYPDDWAGVSFHDHQAAVLDDDNLRLASSMRAAVRVRYIHDTKRYTEAGHETFEEWCDSIDRTKQWGHYYVRAAEHVHRVENVEQAKALSGLSSAEADDVVAAAAGAGPVTGRSLTEARAATVTSNRKAAQEITEAMSVRKVRRCLEKAVLEAQKTTVFTERWYADMERCVSECDGQLELAGCCWRLGEGTRRT